MKSLTLKITYIIFTVLHDKCNGYFIIIREQQPQ